MYPAAIADDHGSHAERRIFTKLRDETPDSWTVLHSVGLANHSSKPWAEIFAADIGKEFTPNDFEMCRPDESTERQLGRAIHEMTAIAEEVLQDPALAADATWNDLLRRAGWTPRG